MYFLQRKPILDQKLYIQKQRYHSLFQQNVSALFSLSLDAQIIQVNKIGLELLGYAKEELIGEQFLKFVHPESIEEFKRVQKIILHKQAATSEAQLFRKDETVVDILGQLVPVMVNEEVVGLTAVIQDISILKQAQRQIEESKERYTSLFYDHSEAMSFISLDGYVEEVNPAFVRLVGYSEDELVGASYMQCIHPDYLEEAKRNFEAARKKLMSIIDEQKLIHRDGTIIDILGEKVPVIVNGEMVGLIRIWEDVTEQKYNEQKREENEQRFRSLFEEHRHGIVKYSTQGYVEDVNKQACIDRICTKEQIMGKHLTNLLPIEYIEDSYRIINNVVANHVAVTSWEILTFANTTKAGIATTIPIYALGKVIGFYNVFRDTTEQNRIKKKLEESEKWYRTLIQLSPEVIFVEKESSIEFMNEEIYHFLRTNTVEATTSIVELIHERDKARVTRSIRTLVKKLTHKNSRLLQDVCFMRCDKSIIQANIAMERVEYGGEPVIIGIIHDTTIRKELEEKLMQTHQQLEKLSRIDQLTGVANRRYYNQKMAKEWKRARREGKQLSVLMLDIDDFKKYNDFYGHQAGDICLKAVADVLTQSISPAVDFVARYGGEEFIIILPNKTEEEALHTAEKIQENLCKLNIPHNKSVYKVVTVSIGVATRIPMGENNEVLVKLADDALYEAKYAGRNCVRIGSEMSWRQK